MKTVTLEQLFEAGCHFGHKTNRWNPKASPYIYKAIGGIHLIDLEKTKAGLEAAGTFISETAEMGKSVLFVGTKSQAQSILQQKATESGAFYLTRRWIGGLITNWTEVKKNLQKLQRLNDEITLPEEKDKYTKREIQLIQEEINKLLETYGGIKDMKNTPDVMVIIDTKRENAALHEALQTNIPLVAIVDTNVDPSPISYPIPANDDAVGSISILISYLMEAYMEGKKKLEVRDKRQEKSKKKAAVAKIVTNKKN
jgi:small subunit ribosomal protein S2